MLLMLLRGNCRHFRYGGGRLRGRRHHRLVGRRRRQRRHRCRIGRRRYGRIVGGQNVGDHEAGPRIQPDGGLIVLREHGHYGVLVAMLMRWGIRLMLARARAVI